MIDLDLKKLMVDACYIRLVSQNCDFFCGDFDEVSNVCKKLKEIAKIAAEVYFDNEID